jgi:hypothetical protein
MDGIISDVKSSHLMLNYHHDKQWTQRYNNINYTNQMFIMKDQTMTTHWEAFVIHYSNSLLTPNRQGTIKSHVVQQHHVAARLRDYKYWGQNRPNKRERAMFPAIFSSFVAFFATKDYYLSLILPH